MDIKKYLWLYKNIGRYVFLSVEAKRLKESFEGLLITDGTIESDVITNKLINVYNQFLKLFANNIIGFKNGLITGDIVSYDLDCYFIDAGEGLVPIGYYCEIRPAESVALVSRYLDWCKTDVQSQKNKLVEIWQTQADKITEIYEKIKNDGCPNRTKGIFGIIVSVLLFVFSIFAFVQLIFMMFVIPVPFFMYFGTPGQIVYIFVAAMMFAFGIVTSILSVKEFKLLSQKKVTGDIVKGIMFHLTKLEQGITIDVESQCDYLYDSARQGNNAKVGQNANSQLVTNINRQIEIADSFSSKSKSQRSGVKIWILIVSLVMCLVWVLSCIPAVQSGIENMFTYDNINPDIPADPPEPQTPKISTYSVQKSDMTWHQAYNSAINSGGKLVCINDRAEFDKVCRMAEQYNINVFWIGAKRNYNDSWNGVKWIDGSDMNFAYWYPNEPSYVTATGEDEEYLMVFRVNGVWYFNDSVNDVSQVYPGKVGYIIEYEE